MGMVGQCDHELSEKGTRQARHLNRNWKKAAQTGCLTPDEEEFMTCEAIFTSPLTRGVFVFSFLGYACT